MYPGSTTDACSPCLLVKGADCAGDVQRVAVVILTGLCVFCFSVLMGRSNTLTSPSGHVPVLCGVPRGFGGDMLPHIPATRAMFA